MMIIGVAQLVNRIECKEDWLPFCNPSDRSLTTKHLQVEPQEKKKTPKGRAKKRITYTRRFVNVTLTGGKRKVRQNQGFSC